MIAIRGLPEAPTSARAEIITRAELADELRLDSSRQDYPPEEQRRDNLALRALGLLEPDQDVAELQLELLGDRVLGFYNDDDKRMVVVSDAGLDVEARITYAHEYTHALQDAAYGIDSLQTDAPGEDDRGLARVSLIEGDAFVTMLAWMFQHLDAAGDPGVPVRDRDPGHVRHPVLDGRASSPSRTTRGSTGRWRWPAAIRPTRTSPRIDAAYADPPASTEQIVDLEKWDARESPRVGGGARPRRPPSAPAGRRSTTRRSARPASSIMLEYLGREPGRSAGRRGGLGRRPGGDRDRAG